MRIIHLSEVMEMAHKSVIEGCKARIVQVGKQFHEKANEPKKWTKQELDLTDGTITITAVLWDKDLVPHTWKDREVTILAHVGDRGPTGVYAWDDDYSKTRKIKMTKTAEIALTGLQDQPASRQQAQRQNPPQREQERKEPPRTAPQQQNKQPQQQEQRTSATATPPKTPEQIKEEADKAAKRVEVAIAKRVHLLYRCLLGSFYAAEQVAIATGGKCLFDITAIQKSGTSLYMDCQRDGLHQKMAAKFAAEPPPKKEPTK